MQSKFKNNILIWCTVMLGGVLVLGTVIPITLNFVEKYKVSAKFDNTVSFAETTKWGQYYDVGTDEVASGKLTPTLMNDFWVKHAHDTNMQLAEIIYGISKFIPTIDTLPSYSYECTIYDYQSRVLRIDKQTQIFQFKFWYAVNVNFHPKNPEYRDYTDKYRFYIDWTRPSFLANPVEGAYNILYSKWYTHTPINEDWELRFTDLEILSHSLVFASEDFENE